MQGADEAASLRLPLLSPSPPPAPSQQPLLPPPRRNSPPPPSRPGAQNAAHLGAHSSNPTLAHATAAPPPFPRRRTPTLVLTPPLALSPPRPSPPSPSPLPCLMGASSFSLHSCYLVNHPWLDCAAVDRVGERGRSRDGAHGEHTLAPVGPLFDCVLRRQELESPSEGVEGRGARALQGRSHSSPAGRTDALPLGQGAPPPPLLSPSRPFSLPSLASCTLARPARPLARHCPACSRSTGCPPQPPTHQSPPALSR